MNVQFFILWVLMLFNEKSPKALANPAFLKNEMLQLQQSIPNNLIVQLVGSLLADLNQFLIFLQKMLQEELNQLSAISLEELQKLNLQLAKVPFQEIYKVIADGQKKALPVEAELLKNYEKIVNILEQAALKTQKLTAQGKKAAFFDLLSSLQNQNSNDIDDESIAEEVEIVRSQRYGG